MLQIFLLGAFNVICDGRPVPETAWHTRQARQLLKILLTFRGKIVPRDFLIEALWPEADPGKAATTLRTAVNALRKTLEPDRPPYTPSTFIVAHAPGYRFHFTTDVWLDALAFDRLLDAVDPAADTLCRQQALNDALALYRDDYLVEDPYADWAAAERDRLRDRYLQALTSLAECQAAQGDFDRAVFSLRRVLARDPGQEPVHRALMRAYLQMGDTASALKTFEQLRQYLLEELGADPAPQTLALHQSILAGQTAWTPALPPLEAPPAASLDAVFVGRQAETDALRRALAPALPRRVFAITGESGVGKTRLANFALTQAIEPPAVVLAARCFSLEQSLPFAPLIEALQTALSQNPDAILPHLAAPDKINLAPLLPSLAWQVDIDMPATGLPEANQTQVVSSLVRLFLTLARRRLVIFLDDAHWVDEQTLTVLSQLSRHLPQADLLLLLTIRADEAEHNLALSQFLHSLNRRNLLETIPLARFSEADIDQYVRRLAPALDNQPDLRHALARRLHATTGGNPFFLAETMRAALDDQPDTLTLPGVRRLLDDPALARPSHHVTDMIVARLDLLPPDARQLLEAAAVIGRDFSLDILETIAPTDPLPALAILLKRQFLVEVEAGRLDFAHHLVRDVMLDRLLPLTRRRLHQRVAQALATVYGRVAGPKAAEIAEHFSLAGAGQREQAFVFAVLAGDHAVRTFGFAQAVRHYRQALELSGHLPPTEALAEWTSRAYQGLGLALESQTDWDEARQAYEDWYQWATTQRDRPQALMARYRLASMLGLLGQLEQSAAITAQISRQLPSNVHPAIHDAQRRLSLLISGGGPPLSPPPPDAVWPSFGVSPLATGRPWEHLDLLGDNEHAAQTLNVYGWALMLQGHTDVAESTLTVAASLAAGAHRPDFEATSCHLLAQLYDALGDYGRMEQAINRALHLIEGSPKMRWIVLWGLIHRAYVDMRWNQLARAEERLQTLDAELSGRDMLRSHWLSVQVGRGVLAALRGEWARATHYFDLALQNAENLYASNYVAVYLGRARIQRKQGHFEAAKSDVWQAIQFAVSKSLTAEYISAVVEASRLERVAGGRLDEMAYLLQQAEDLAGRAGLLPARLSVRLALMHIFAALRDTGQAQWYRRLARTDRDAIVTTIPQQADRQAYLARLDLRQL